MKGGALVLGALGAACALRLYQFYSAYYLDEESIVHINRL
jgi:hypothetical protein